MQENRKRESIKHNKINVQKSKAKKKRAYERSKPRITQGGLRKGIRGKSGRGKNAKKREVSREKEKRMTKRSFHSFQNQKRTRGGRARCGGEKKGSFSEQKTSKKATPKKRKTCPIKEEKKSPYQQMKNGGGGSWQEINKKDHSDHRAVCKNEGGWGKFKPKPCYTGLMLGRGKTLFGAGEWADGGPNRKIGYGTKGRKTESTIKKRNHVIIFRQNGEK